MARPKIWNVHSLRAFSVHPYGCWGMWSEQLDKDKYKCYADHFTAENFDASEWAELAKEAGMKYMVLTTKHHDGFSLWYSKSCLENFTSVNYGAKKDFVKEYTDACRNAGLMVGLYYSPLDWRFPGFFLPKLFEASANALRKQAFDQLNELTTQYGKIDLLWFDGCDDWGGTTNRDNKMYVHICEWTADEIIIPDTGNPEITCLTCQNPVIRKDNGKIFLSVDNESKQAIDTIFELTYKEKVTDIFKDVIDYADLTNKKNEFTLSVNLGE